MTTKRGIKYEGFGKEKTAAEWAKIAGLPRNSVGRYLAAGWTVEEIFLYRRIKYDPQDDATEWMKRVGHRQVETINLIMELLENSGYKPSAGAIVVKVLSNNNHIIDYRNQRIGRYDYKQDILYLPDGNRLSLKNPIVPTPKITHARNGVWILSRETKHAIIEKMRIGVYEE